jgi:hypothetical protein
MGVKMSNENGSGIRNYSLKIFEEIIMFDKEEVIKHIKNPGKKFLAQKDVQKQILKGYSKTNKMSDEVVLNRFTILFKNKNNFHIPGKLMDKFFSNFIYFFDSILNNLFYYRENDKIAIAVDTASDFFGWSQETIYCLLNYYIGLFKKDIQELIRIEKQFDNLHNKEKDKPFDRLISDPVKFWRPIFSFDPSYLLSSVKNRHKDIERDEIDNLLSATIDNKDIVSFNAVNVNNIKNSIPIKKVISNTVLGGIDVDNIKIIKLAIDKFYESNLINRRDVSLLTTIALGHVYLNEYGNAIKVLKKLRMDDVLNVKFLPGFIGSIYFKMSNDKMSSEWYFLEFNNRYFPCAWPIKFFEKYLNPKELDSIILRDNINLDSNFIDKLQGQKIIEFVKLNSGIKTENIIEKFLEKVEPEKLDENSTNIENSVTQEVHRINDIYPSLINLYKIFLEIEDNEIKLEEFQKYKDYTNLGIFAKTLNDLWDSAVVELKSLSFSKNVNEIIANKDSFNLFELLNDLNIEYKDKEKDSAKKINDEKSELLKLAQKYKIENVSIIENITKNELIVIRKSIEKEILKKNSKVKLLTGDLNVNEFRNVFEKDEHQSLILESIDIDECVFNENLINILSTVKWSSKNRNKILNILDECIAIEGNKYINDECITNTIIPLLDSINNDKVKPVIEIVFEKNNISDLFINYFLNVKSEMSIKHLIRLNPLNINEILESYQTILKSNDKSVSNLNIFIKEFIKNNDELVINAKILLLSKYLDYLELKGKEIYSVSLIDLYVLLRDLLLSDSKKAESTILVSAVWSKYRDETIFTDYEDTVYNLLINLINIGNEGKKIAFEIMQTPNWIISQKYGIILFLYLCHIGNFTDLFENAKYHYFSLLEEHRIKFPILIDKFFCEYRFNEIENGSTYIIDNRKCRLGLKVIEDIKTGLRKSTCYNSWRPAALYQKLFNKQLSKYLIFLNNEKLSEDHNFISTIQNIDENEWILEANKKLNSNVKSPAIDLMKKYIKEQKKRLEILIKIKIETGILNLERELKVGNESLKEKLKKEYIALNNENDLLKLIYQQIWEIL